MSFPAANSPLMRVLNRIGDLVLLNVLFVVSCLPVVTLGPALCALTAAAMKVVRGESQSTFDDYVTSFRQNLKPGIVLGMAATVLVAALGAWALVLDQIQVSNVARFALWAIWFVLTARVVLVLPWVFAYQATFEDSVATVVRNARLMSIRHLFSSLLMAGMNVMSVLVTVFYPQMFIYGLVWFTIGLAVLACAHAAVLATVFQRYGLTEAERPAGQE